MFSSKEIKKSIYEDTIGVKAGGKKRAIMPLSMVASHKLAKEVQKSTKWEKNQKRRIIYIR